MRANHKRLLGWSTLIVPAAITWSLALTQQPKRARADIAAGRQDYIIMGRESQVRDLMDEYLDSVGTNAPGADTNPNPDYGDRNYLQSVISFTASANDELVAYDHWEDGLSSDPFNVSDPANATTVYFNMQRGQSVSLLSTNQEPDASFDNNDNCTPAGIAAGHITGGASCSFSGQTVTPTVNACSYYCAGVLTGSAQPYTARSTSDIRFDGGDRISAIGGPITLVRRLNPLKESFAGGALEELSLQSLRGFLNFVVPVGQNGTGASSSFSFARAFITAYYDDTVVTINNGSSTVQVTLQAGQTYSTRGKNTSTRQATIDETVVGAAQQIELLTGTRIDATKEVAVGLGNGGATANHLDLEALLPVRAYGRDFIIPFGSPESPLDAATTARLFLFNPNTSAATVTVYDRRTPTGGALFVDNNDDGDTADAGEGAPTTIDASGQAVHLLARSTWGETPSYPIPTRIRSSLPIWGFVVYDANRGGKDWSHAPIPTRFLTTEYVVPDTPSTNGGQTSGNCIFIAPTQDNTTVRFYFPGDDTADIIDLDQDGDRTDQTGGGGTGDSRAGDDCPLTRMGCVSASDAKYVLRTYSAGFDPYADDDGVRDRRNGAMCVGGGGVANLAGMRIIADKPIVAVYGQNGEVQEDNGGDDFGYSLVPPSLMLMDELMVASVRGEPGSIPSGDGATFNTIVAATAGQVDLTSIYAFVTFHKDWVSGNTEGSTINVTVNHPGNANQAMTCELRNLAVASGAPYAPLAANPTSATTDRYICNLAGVDLPAANSLAMTIPLTTNATIGTANQTVSVEFYAEVGGQSVRPTASRIFTRSYLGLTLSAASTISGTGATVAPAAELRYTYTLSNSSTTQTISGMQVRMVIPDGLDYVPGSADVAGGLCALDNITSELVCDVTGTLAVAPSAGTPTTTTLSFDVTAQVIPGGTMVEASGTASGSNSTAAASNSLSTEVLSTDLTATTSASRAYTGTPGTFTVSVLVANNSDFAVNNVVVTLNQPTGTTASGSPAGTIALGTIAANSSATATFTITVAAGQADATQYIFSPQITATESTVPTGGNTVTVTVDASGPALTAQAQVGTQPENTVAIQGTVSDNLGVSTLQFQLCNMIAGPACGSTCGTATALTPPASPATAWTSTTNGHRAGTYCVKVTATDTAANSSVANILNYVVTDTVPPAMPVVTGPGDESQQPTVGTITFTGTAEPGVSVIVSFNNSGAQSQTVTADSGGNWTAAFTANGGDPFDYAHTAISVIANDGANNSPTYVPSPDNGSTGYFLNIGLPASPTVTTPSGNPTVGPGAITVTGGGAEAGATVIVTVPGVGEVTVIADGSGNWSVQTPGGLPGGPLDIEVRQENQYGIRSNPTIVPVTVDATPPANPVVTSPVVIGQTPTVVSAAGFLVTGTGEPGSTIVVSVPLAGDYTTTVDGGGNWSVAVPGPIGDRLINVEVTAEDSLGNSTQPIVLPLYADSGPPIAPVLTSPTANQTVPGTNVTFTGTGEPGATVTVTVDGQTGTGVVDNNGNFTVVVAGPLSEGPHTATVTQTDPANQVSPGVTVSVVVDATAPSTPTIDTVTDNTGPGGGVVVSGTAEPGSTVEVTIGGTTVTTTAGSDGSYTVVVPGAPQDGEVSVVAVDPAGNRSLPQQRGYSVGSGVGTGSGSSTGGGSNGAFNDVRVIGGVGRGCQSTTSGDLSGVAVVLALALWRRRKCS